MPPSTLIAIFVVAWSVLYLGIRAGMWWERHRPDLRARDSHEEP